MAPRKKVIGWSPAAERLLGYRAHEIVGRPLETLLPHLGTRTAGASPPVQIPDDLARELVEQYIRDPKTTEKQLREKGAPSVERDAAPLARRAAPSVNGRPKASAATPRRRPKRATAKKRRRARAKAR